MAAKLGDFLVNIKTVSDDTGTQSVVKSLGNLTTRASKLGATFTGIVAGAGAGFVKLVQSTVSETAELGRLADDLGVTTDFLETLMRSFETVGAGPEEAISTIRTLRKEIEAFKLGRGNIEAFGILGINPQVLSGDVSKSLDTIRKRFNGLTKAQQLYFVSQIGLGEKSLRILRLNDKAYADLAKTSKEIPLATEEQIQSAEEYERNTKRITQSFRAFKRELVSGVTPAFVEFSKQLTTLLGDEGFKNSVSGIFDSIFKEGLPLIIKSTPIVIDQISKITKAVVNLSDSFDNISDNAFVKALSGIGKVAGFAAEGLGSAGELIGRVGAGQGFGDAFSESILKNAPRPGSLTYVGGSNQSIPAAEAARQSSKDVSNNITINVNGANGSPASLARIIASELDRTLKTTTENLKTGVIQ